MQTVFSACSPTDLQWSSGAESPLVGRVCMDLCMVDVTDIPGVVPGDVATLYGDKTPGGSGRGTGRHHSV